MLRFAAVVVGLISVALLTAQAIAVGLLAMRGQLNEESVAVITAALAGELPRPAADSAAASPPPPPETAAEREASSTLASLELKAQADELRLLKELLAAQAADIQRRREAFDTDRKTFADELAALRARNTDEATEQARSVLKSLPTTAAVTYLLPLPEAEAVQLLRGLPEKTVAKILQQFAAGADEQQQYGRAMFAAIYAGEPEQALMEAAAESAAPPR